MTTLLFSDTVFAAHETPPGHPERADRYVAVERALSGEEFAGLVRRTPPLVARAAVERAHSRTFIDRIEASAPTSGMIQLDPDTYLGVHSLEAARRAAGGAVAAVDAIFSGEAQNAFVAARPPGHHALPDQAMGFCVFNTAAIGALHARAAHGATRIAIVDFDVHHGNGGEAVFWHDENAFYASSHEYPQYPGTGRASDRGAFDNVANAPLPTGAGGEEFRRAWGERLLPALSQFGPQMIVISAGFDAHRADPLGGLELTESDFAWITREIAAIAADKCAGRLISVLEGGYDLKALAGSAAAHVTVLMEARKPRHNRADRGVLQK